MLGKWSHDAERLQAQQYDIDVGADVLHADGFNSRKPGTHRSSRSFCSAASRACSVVSSSCCPSCKQHSRLSRHGRRVSWMEQQGKPGQGPHASEVHTARGLCKCEPINRQPPITKYRGVHCYRYDRVCDVHMPANEQQPWERPARRARSQRS